MRRGATVVAGAVLGAVLASGAGAYAQAQAPAGDAQVKARVDLLLAQMTLEEKVGQLSQAGGIAFGGAPEPEEALRKGAGSVLWINDTRRFNELQKIAMQSRLKIPVLYGLDVIHGYRTIFPIPIGMASSWDPQVHERAAEIAAREARAAGIHWTFAPMVDVARDARWGRIAEGAGEDPYLGAAMAAAQVRGFQGPYLGAPDRLLACAKHFAAYGKADGGRDYDPVYVSETELRNVYLPPFAAAAKAGVGSFMSAYMDLNDVPAAANPWLLRDVLRGEWGFTGFVVSDALAVEEPAAAGLRPRREGRGGALAAGRARHGHGERDLRPEPGRAREGRRREGGAGRRRRAPGPRRQGAARALRAALRRRGARRVRARRPEEPHRGAPPRGALDGAAQERQAAAAAQGLARERRRDRPARRLEGRHRGVVDGVRARAGRGHGARGPARPARRREGRLRTRPGDPPRGAVVLRGPRAGSQARAADARAGRGGLRAGGRDGARGRARGRGDGRARRHER